MRSIGIVLLLLIASSPARGEGPIVVNANLGINVPVSGDVPLTCHYDHDSKHQPVLNVDVAYRFIAQLAVGIHFGARHYPWEQCGGGQSYRGLDTAFELGVGVQWSWNRFWAAPWVGFQQEDQNVGTIRGRYLAYALNIGFDAYVHPSGHHVGVYLDLTVGTGDSNPYGHPDDERNLSAGIAYRYW